MARPARKEELQIDDIKIINILANNKLFCNSWQHFCKAFNIENALLYDLERLLYTQTPIKVIVSKILKVWKGSDPDNANIKCLPGKLRQIGCIECSEDIENLSKNYCDDNTGISATVTITDLETTFGKHHLEAPIHSRQRKDEPEIWFNIREPTTYYMGRENEMKIIEAQFKYCLNKKSIKVVAITGLGGIGKTEMARNYAKYFAENIKGHCIWFDSETDKSLSQSLQDLAEKELNIFLKDESGKEKNQTTLLKEIYTKISGKPSLIVFDNLESYDKSILVALSELTSKQPPTIIKPFAITTSRFRPAKRFFGNKCVHLELDILEEESAVEFFTKSFNANEHLHDKIYSDAVGQLCGRLKCYPLAMQQAAAYINGNLSNPPNASTLAKDIEKYLEKLEKEAKNLLDHKLPQFEALESHSRTTFLTWKVTFQKIMETPGNGNEAIQLMNIISFMSPDNIAKDFLINLFRRIEQNDYFKPESKDDCTIRNENSLELLRNHSMIKITEETISIHRLVQEITRIDLEEQEELILTLDKMVQCMQKMMKDKDVSLGQLIHVEMVWQFVIKNTEMIKKYPNFPHRISYKLYISGRYQDSLDFSCRAVKELESILGMENRSTLKMTYWKGVVLRELGEYGDSLSLLLKVYGKQKELFGEEDAECLSTARSIGIAYYKLKDYEEAIKWYEDALEKSERVSGKEHNSTLNLKHSLALALTGHGKSEEAMELHKEVLQVQERRLGKKHRNTLNTKHNMAYILFEEKKFEEALKMFQEALKMREKVLELNHPYTLTTKYMIACIYKYLGKVEVALQLAEEVYDKQNKILGPQHPDTIYALNLLEDLLKKPTEA